MPKKKNNRRNKEKLSEQEDKINDFDKQLSEAIKGLFYISETDAEVVLFNGQKADSVTQENLLLQLGKNLDVKIKEVGFDYFFVPLIKLQDWFGEDERKMTESFSKLKDLLQQNLRNIKVYKIGKKEIDIYIVGLDSESVLCGVQTKAVET